eukprot:g6410.t1
MQDASSPVFETTDAGFRVSGTGQPRLEAAARAGAEARSQRSLLGGWRSIMWRRPLSRTGHPRGRRADPYAGEEGPGRVSRLKRLRMDLWGYGAGKTKDAYGTEADVRAISGRNARWAGFKLRVLTQNLWGLPVVSRCLEARVHAFAKTLGGGWDVVALQEVWHARERDALRSAALAAGLRYSRHFEHGCGAPVLGQGMGGTGLLVLSRFPIAESVFWRFSANGQPYQLQHADYLGGKGVGLARVHTPAGAVDLYVSHLHADYSRAKDSTEPDRYKAHRVAQAFELAHIIRLTSRSPLVLLLSDLNAGPESMAYGLQRSVAGLEDAFAEAKPAEVGHTCEATDNMFSNGRDSPARLDYVLFKALPPPLCAPQAVEPTWELNDCWVHRSYIPEEDTDDALLSQVRPPQPPPAPGGSRSNRSPTAAASPAATAGLQLAGSAQQRQARPNGDGPGAARSPSPSSPTLGVSSPSSLSSPVRARGGSLVDGVGFVGARAGGDGGGGRDVLRSPSRGGAARRINVSDHHGVAAEFTARDPEAEDDDEDDMDQLGDGTDDGRRAPRLTSRHSHSIVGGTFPQGPLLARALTEIDRGIEASSTRRVSHLRSAKALAVLWISLLAGGALAKSDGPMGFIARGATGTFGGLLCAAASALFLAYWFSAKEEVQGLKEVFQTATNYERHLPMEEAFPDTGFGPLESSSASAIPASGNGVKEAGVANGFDDSKDSKVCAADHQVSTDAAALATSILACPDGDFAVEWVGEVLIEETIHVTGGTSLDIAGAGPGAIADGGGDTQLFAVDGDSRLHLSDMILSNGNASYGGAIFANQSSVSFTGNMSFISNSAEFGGAILSLESILSWNGDSTDFSFNSADIDGGAIWAGDGSSVSWTGDETTFISNNAISGGAITAYNFSTVFWDGDNTTFSNNSAAAYGGGAIVAFMSSTVSWDGDGSSFSFNSAALNGGAIWAVGSTVSWFGDDTTFDSNNAAGLGGAIFAQDSTVAWEGDGTSFISNSDAEFGGAIFAQDDSTVTWEGDCTEFSNNSAALDGGAIWAGNRSTVSWTGSDVAFVSNSAESGGAILAYQLSSVSWADGTTIFSNNSAAVNGGAILAWDSSNVSWKGDGTVFTFNNASDSGGAIFAQHSTVSWDGNGTIFSNNSAAASEGGAVCAWNSSTVSWHGDGTVFTFNKAVFHGGAIFAQDSTVAWEGDDTEFSNNSVANFFSTSGGAILARESTVSWNGDGTVFVSNSGCAVYAYISNVSWVGDDTAFISNSGGAITSFISSNVSWDGDGTEFSYNHGLGGGAIAVEEYSTVAWKGKGTVFISNSVEYDGGAIQVLASTLLMDINTTFRSNFAEGNGGALAISNLDENNEIGRLNGTAFIGNSAETAGGAVYMSDNEHSDIDFTEVMFESNSAGGSGGAVAAFTTGNALESTWFQRCTFLNNRANDSGGAVETLAGRQFLYNCDYAGNSADVGGAMRLGGETFVSDSSFLSNYATSRGLAIAVVSSSHTSISKSSFEGNELYCRAGFYRRDVQEEGFNPRYETVCLDCPDWDECFDCTIGRSNVMPTCEASLEHTTASEPGITVETLNINEGYWRATNTSENILECYNTDACSGGMTGADSFCAPGYTGPYCAVCETGYSPSLANTCTRCSSSRRRGLLAATVIAAVVAVLAVAAIFKFLLSTEVEEEKIGWFHSRVLRAVPVQALKIVVVVWQILTQFADAASISYPGVYQDFLSAIDVVNFDLGSVLAAGCLCGSARSTGCAYIIHPGSLSASRRSGSTPILDMRVSEPAALRARPPQHRLPAARRNFAVVGFLPARDESLSDSDGEAGDEAYKGWTGGGRKKPMVKDLEAARESHAAQNRRAEAAATGAGWRQKSLGPGSGGGAG